MFMKHPQDLFGLVKTELIVTIVVVLALVLFSAAFVWLTTFEKEVTVSNTYTKYREYYFVDEAGDVYEVNDSLWHWSWGEAENWLSLKEGRSYRVRGYGFRFAPILGMYPQITSVQPA